MKTLTRRSAPAASRMPAPELEVGAPRATMTDVRDDGVHVINIYSGGATRLGAFLSNFTHAPMDLPAPWPGEAAPGRFASVEGYWYWLGLQDHPRADELRRASGFKAKALGRELRAGREARPVTRFEDRIRAAITHKVRAHPEMCRALRASELPFVHYYARTTLRDAGYPWIVDHIEALRRTLQAEGARS